MPKARPKRSQSAFGCSCRVDVVAGLRALHLRLFAGLRAPYLRPGATAPRTCVCLRGYAPRTCVRGRPRPRNPRPGLRPWTPMDARRCADGPWSCPWALTRSGCAAMTRMWCHLEASWFPLSALRSWFPRSLVPALRSPLFALRSWFPGSRSPLSALCSPLLVPWFPLSALRSWFPRSLVPALRSPLLALRSWFPRSLVPSFPLSALRSLLSALGSLVPWFPSSLHSTHTIGYQRSTAVQRLHRSLHPMELALRSG
jgi:hypothetical protein